MDISSFYGRSRKTKHDELSSDSDIISSNDIFQPDRTAGSECDESSDTSEENNNENEVETREGSPKQDILQNATSNERKFSFSGKEELSIKPNPSHEGKIWPIDVYSLFVTDSIIEMIVRETNCYADYLQLQQGIHD